ANQGESNAQFHLGKIYKDGLGVDKNLSLARTWFEKSAEAGNSYAAQELSKMN
ncbi:SEL1-like repeat protein, partial [Acinetobacter baumannii]